MTINIGQYRFNESDNIAVHCETNAKYIKSTSGYNDIAVSYTSGSFSSNYDYYVRAQIPRDLNYSYTITIKLIKEYISQITSNTTFYTLKKFNVAAGGEANVNRSYVVIYQLDDDGPVECQIATKATTTQILNPKLLDEDKVYYTVESESSSTATPSSFYIKKNGTLTQILNINGVWLSHIWKHISTDNFATMEMIFRPEISGNATLIFEIQRTNEDGFIHNSDGSVGREIELTSTTGNQFGCDIYQLNNIVDDIYPDGALDRIGLWGHSGMMFAVNGEELHVGPSGYYELHQVQTDTLSVFAPNSTQIKKANIKSLKMQDAYENLFTVDYEYNNEITTEGE
jgi:hypothetical protein